MSELKKHFKRLMGFARRNNFGKPFSNVYFVEGKSIRYSLKFNETDEIFRRDFFSFEHYENRFDEILNQGHSWVNMNFAGVLEGNLLIVIETPNYKNNTPREFVSVNLSLPKRRILENDWEILPFYKITN
jgi:hypothetical protein